MYEKKNFFSWKIEKEKRITTQSGCRFQNLSNISFFLQFHWKNILFKFLVPQLNSLLPFSSPTNDCREKECSLNFVLKYFSNFFDNWHNNIHSIESKEEESMSITWSNLRGDLFPFHRFFQRKSKDLKKEMQNVMNWSFDFKVKCD